MGFHQMSKRLIWGDDQAEIAAEAIAKIDEVYQINFERRARPAELYYGLILAVLSHVEDHEMDLVWRAHIDNETDECPFVDKPKEKDE